MATIGKGMVAGFVATLVLSAIILLIDRVTTPEFNPARVLTITATGAATPLLGWIVHFFIGTVAWGIIFSFLDENLPGPHWARGIIFGSGIWLLITIFMVPLVRIVPLIPTIVTPVGGNVFGGARNLFLSIEMLILHWVYGAVLGGVYGMLLARQDHDDMKPARL
jgi:uncharacterized membrane protein YagU involved in acid resistance